MPAENSNPPPPAVTVRYSLPALLAELKLERTTGSFAQEKIDQVEITKLFTTSARRRAKPKK